VKIAKDAAKRHRAALDLVRSGRRLTLDEREQVLADFHEGAEHMNSLAGAFFTPDGLARDLAIEVPECDRLLDLCAGIGALSHAARDRAREVVCVEVNPQYAEVGRVVVPDATWICADALDPSTWAHLGPFDVVISNPPHGRVPGSRGSGPFEYRAIEAASRHARYGVFLIPQESAPFTYSGRRDFQHRREREPRHRSLLFQERTGLVLDPGCGVDTATYRTEWRGASPLCEIVTCDFPARDTA
jgi:predicted RNA methylase